MIELEHLEKRYGAQAVVQDLNLVFPAGQVTALLGPSGCGKTTTLRMINRLIEPTAGVVRLDGQDTRGLRPEVLRRGIGYVIQQIGLFPHLNVAQNVATVPELLGRSRQDTARRVDELLALVGLDPDTFRHKRPAQLSGGQAQRVGVARALAADPPVLLMDEPFGALDPLAREHLQQAFREIQRRLHKTVVMVTHDIDEALRLGDRIALMNAGRLEQFGTPDDLVHRPTSSFVSAFLGEDAALRQLAGYRAADFMNPGEKVAGLPTVEASLDARSALGVMLREGSDRLTVMTDGVPAGVLHWSNLRREP
ncbi:ABC transporter ATP-binding protein [Deinococcus malanensis]|uniref:ABC transporter ATP-binding protein n=1 Tax=Deinococcus malanensis TaxID=1706855 RepID=A0ABQ2EYR9_9DEIO|nr:ABC transporter ATP-binding protein [Deinococcus malanensis]GGK31084.1 ABC transporter ATP-binding protein [Deinococcus malanensis]